MVSTSDEREGNDIDTWIGKANVFMLESYRSEVIKRGLSNIGKRSVSKWVVVPILIYSHESWAIAEGMPSQVQATEVGFLRGVHGVTPRVKMHSCEIPKTLNVETLL